MALHLSPESMKLESLDESLEAARYCIEYRKTDAKWGEFATGGILGYPAGILLFSVVDTIGSYYKNKPLPITIDGAPSSIGSAAEDNFRILNSQKYFNQNLSAKFLKAVYGKFRSALTHNSVMGKNALMFPDNSSIPIYKKSNVAFEIGKDNLGNEVYLIFIRELYLLCLEAVTEFKKEIIVDLKINK
jgi:hypothetical protein